MWDTVVEVLSQVGSSGRSMSESPRKRRKNTSSTVNGKNKLIYGDLMLYLHWFTFNGFVTEDT